MPTSSRRIKKHASRTDPIGSRPAVAKTSLKLLLALRSALRALGLSFFPAAFVGSLWRVPAAAVVACGAWFSDEGRRACPKQLAVVVIIVVAYFAPSIVPCWTG